MRTRTAPVEHKIDAHVAVELEHVAAQELPSLPTQLVLENAVWSGAKCLDIRSAMIGDDGRLVIDGTPPNRAALTESGAWSAIGFSASVPDRGTLEVVDAVSHFLRMRWSVDTGVQEITARIESWSWRIDDPTAVSRLWVAPLRFASTSEPVFLRMPNGNMRLNAGGANSWGWRFESPAGLAYVIPSRDRSSWSIAFDSPSGAPPAVPRVVHALVVFGFVVGEPLAVGLFTGVGPTGITNNRAHLGVADLRFREGSQQPPALLCTSSATSIVDFVEKVLSFISVQPNSPMLTALHHHAAALGGFVDSQFLHAWIATETLCTWGIANQLLRDGGQVRLADHVAWMQWVAANEAEIRKHAAQGMEQQLVDRVRGAEIDRPTSVQRAFLGESLPWTPEMDDAQLTRHGVAHRGVMPGPRPIRWEQNSARVGLAKTLLTSIIARLVGYVGPIADRSKTCTNISGDDQPSWWSAVLCPQEHVYLAAVTPDAAAEV